MQHHRDPVSQPIDIDSWIASLHEKRSEKDLALIRQACERAVKAHTGQSRISGEPYIMHSLAVAQILDDMHLDAETITAAILHDVVEDSDITLAEVEQGFGKSVSLLVDGVTKVDIIQDLQESSSLQSGYKSHGEPESLRKMLLAMAEDVRVVLIKLADRLHNLRTLHSLPRERQQQIARETMDIFAPLANRLGIWRMKWQLEDLSFRYLQPDEYKNIVSMLAERRSDREDYISAVIESIKKELNQADIRAEISGRAKHIYGIWKKMQYKDREFSQIFDVRAIRILVSDVADCYATLGAIHGLWKYIPGEFDDYIATPKENNYQSLHTAVIGTDGKTLEIQIRTKEMHQQAEMGIAAHWRYKEDIKQEEAFDRKIDWLRQLLEWKDEVAEASDFVDQFKSEVFSDRVYIFTPHGKIIDLPHGATPLDFAYYIHTEVGHRCRGAKVNGHIVPLGYQLKTGEQVEILTIKNGVPSRDWLNPHLGYLTTSRAKNKIRHWFRQQNYQQNMSAGRDILERELHRIGLSDVNFEKLAHKLKYSDVDDFMAAIGRGDIKSSQIINKAQEQPALKSERSDQPIIARQQPAAARTAGLIDIQGVGNLLTRIANCCKPVPGDPIVGYITQGQGVSVHRRDCPNILAHSADREERLIEVDWGQDDTDTFPVDIRVVAYDRQGLLRDITAIFANEKINVIVVNTRSDKQKHIANMTLTVEIPGLDSLSRVLGLIDQLPNIIQANRVLG